MRHVSVPGSGRPVPFENVLYLRHLVNDVMAPNPETPFCVDSRHPRTHRGKLGSVLVTVLALYFEHKCSPVCQSDQEVWYIPTFCAVPHVVDLESKMIILGIGFNQCARFEQVRYVLLPGAIGQHVADLRAHRRVTDLGRVPGAHLPCAANRKLFVKDRLDPFKVLFGDEPKQVLHDAINAERN